MDGDGADEGIAEVAAMLQQSDLGGEGVGFSEDGLGGGGGGRGGSSSFGVLLIIGMAVLAQYLIRQWQVRSPRSFQVVTLCGLWFVPLLVCVALLFFRFLVVWLLFTVVTAYLIRLSFRQPMSKSLPRTIYFWFSVVHKLSYSAAVLGYVLVLMNLFGVLGVGTAGFTLCFYGLYFGVMCRDCADLSCELIVAKLGYYSPGTAMPRRSLRHDICALCDDELGHDPTLIIQLPCQHSYHSACLKGWAMIGKKDTCAYCREKIRLKEVLDSSAWRSQSILWAQLLDAVRMIIVWNPLVLVVMDTVLRTVGYGPHAPQPTQAVP